VTAVPADLILLDVMMPGLDGFEVCRALKENPATRDIPVIFLTTLSSAVDEERGLSLGAEDFIHKPFSPAVVFARVRNHLRLSQGARLLRTRNEDLERLVSERTRHIVEQSAELVRRKQQLIAAQDATISAFCSLAEARDYETGNHIRRTQHYVRAIAEQVRDREPYRSELSDETIDLLFKSAPLHDVGKVAIPDAVLLKPGKLDREEWEVMKQPHRARARRHPAGGGGSRRRQGTRSCAMPARSRRAITSAGTAPGYPDGLRARRSRCPRGSWRSPMSTMR
jgi:putative two-component system response regulator